MQAFKLYTKRYIARITNRKRLKLLISNAQNCKAHIHPLTNPRGARTQPVTL